MTVATRTSATSTTTLTLEERYQAVRDHTEALAAPLSAEDQVVQSMPDASPTKWHRAHVTWFFEAFLLLPHSTGYVPVDRTYLYLFNSYYEGMGERHSRPRRGMITRPSVEDIKAYRNHVDAAMLRLIATQVPRAPELVDLIELGLQHEQQHQELLLMDIKHLFSSTVVRPAYRSPSGRSDEAVEAARWIDFDGGIVDIGADGPDFHFDNEGPRHHALLAPYQLADRLVTAGEWLDFMADGGYQDATLWLSDGWHTVQASGWDAPHYWRRDEDGRWLMYTLEGERTVDPDEPVVHISYYEADAFARWAGVRLPTEFEWEAAASESPIDADPDTLHRLHPFAVRATGMRQLYGHAWQWTSSAYASYPGFRPAEGAVGEYNGKFMIDQQVLRGSCAVTPAGHSRSTYRNFFPARARWQFGGLRLAKDAS